MYHLLLCIGRQEVSNWELQRQLYFEAYEQIRFYQDLRRLLKRKTLWIVITSLYEL